MPQTYPSWAFFLRRAAILLTFLPAATVSSAVAIQLLRSLTCSNRSMLPFECSMPALNLRGQFSQSGNPQHRAKLFHLLCRGKFGFLVVKRYFKGSSCICFLQFSSSANWDNHGVGFASGSIRLTPGAVPGPGWR